MKPYAIGLYEKAMPKTKSWREKLQIAKECGYDFVEISIDETDDKLARLDWSKEERSELVRTMQEEGIPIRSMCLSGHRKYPLGDPDPEIRARSMEIMEKAVILADDLGIDEAGDQGQDGAKDAHADDQQQGLAHTQGLRRGDGAWRGGDEHVGDVQTAGQAHGHGHAGLAGALHQGLADGVQDDEAGVTEHGDGDNPAHELHGQLGVLLAHQGDDHVGQLQGSAGLFQNRADEGAQDDDDTDGGESAREARADDAGDLGERDTGQDGQHERDAHDRQEGMDLQLGDQ